ncbi:DEAD/DEAH box helicase [Betaproteobacteria bacterium PRO7]|nr:DEAD/DEAH box helicase [Betaproteobacteria bacterium PRO7]GIL05139.1 MAG: ATP-dependent RNA helicase RhlE [Betaproteobacteria bacterium]
MSSDFQSLGLAPELVRAVADEGYTQPTPIQSQAIPLILAGRDLLAAAQTGTGKTAGFTLPILQRLAAHAHKPAPKTVRVLVLTPTRELAAQVEEAVRTYGKHLRVSSAVVFGGVGIVPQIAALKRGVDILVATPGRLLDHVGQRTVDLSKVEVLVLDEADRMLDMGFIHDIKRVLAQLPKRRQNLLFSATFSDEIRALAHGLLHDPATVEVARRNEASALVTQVMHPVSKERKRELLRDLIAQGDWRQVLVFTRMKHGANRLAEQLNKDGLEAAAIHGNKSQGARTRALAGFKDGSVRVLVATDIAARGLDIEQLPHVVNYELPNVPEDYVHRIGRTGRAGSPGHAVSLVSPDEYAYLRDIERLLKKPIERMVVPGFEAGKPGTIPVEDERRPPRPQQRTAKPHAPIKHAARPAEAKRGEHRHPRPVEAQPKRSHAPHPPRPAKPAQTSAHSAQRHERRPRRDEDGNVRSNLPPALQAAFRRAR